MHFYVGISISLSELYQALFVYVHDWAQFWTNYGNPRAHTIDSDIHKPYTIQCGLRNDTVLGLKVLVSWSIMCWVVGLILKKHHILQEYNAFIFTVIKNLSRISQPSKKKVLHSLKQWVLLTPLNSTTSHRNQNLQQIHYKNLKSHRVHGFLNPVSNRQIVIPNIMLEMGTASYMW
jgi:hypothetical protein